jgi:hypothetical protein
MYYYNRCGSIITVMATLKSHIKALHLPQSDLTLCLQFEDRYYKCFVKKRHLSSNDITDEIILRQRCYIPIDKVRHMIHDVRSGITGIIGIGYLIDDSDLNGVYKTAASQLTACVDKQSGYINDICTNCLRLNLIIETLQPDYNVAYDDSCKVIVSNANMSRIHETINPKTIDPTTTPILLFSYSHPHLHVTDMKDFNAIIEIDEGKPMQ